MVSVAFDVGPLHGRRTGIGNALAWTLDDLEDRPSVELIPYVTSARARLTPPQRRLPLPAAAAHRLWARSSAPRVDRWLGNPDVVHGTNYVVPPARCARVVSVYDCWFLEHPGLAGPDVRRAGAALRRAVADGADVLTCSHATAGRVRTLLDARRVHTVHLGPPPITSPAERPAARQDLIATDLRARLDSRPFVLALGTVERRKNLPTLVAAFEMLAVDSPDTLLVIAGADGDTADELARRVGRLAPTVAERVLRVQPVDGGLKSWLLGHTAALAYPSLDEGFGFPILEAQQAGIPVVAADAGSIGEIAGGSALLAASDDVDGLAANLHTALTDRAVHAEMIERGTANVARFSWRATGDGYVALYHDLAERAR